MCQLAAITVAAVERVATKALGSVAAKIRTNPRPDIAVIANIRHLLQSVTGGVKKMAKCEGGYSSPFERASRIVRAGHHLLLVP